MEKCHSRLTLILIASAALAFSPARAQPDQQPDQPGAGLSEAQDKAAVAADAYAATIAESRSTAEYSSRLRFALNPAYRDSVAGSSEAVREITTRLQQQAITGGEAVGLNSLQRVPAGPTMTALDIDPRYRSNLQGLVDPSQPRERIWGGIPTSRYQNTVVITGGSRICTGTIIGARTVVTAQHCHCRNVTQEVRVTNDFDDSTPFYRVVRSTPMKPCNSPGSQAADVAILAVDRDFEPAVVPARLASTDQIDQAREVRAVGFGRTETGSIGRKMMVDVPVVSVDCRGTVPASAGPTSDAAYYGCQPGFELVAAAPVLAKDTCGGDSGGPIFVTDAAGNEFLAGATSRGIDVGTRQDCGQGGIYVRIDGPTVAWLRSQGAVN